MDDSGVSENVGTILMIMVLVIVAGFVLVYVMDVGGTQLPADYTPQYAVVDAKVVPALSAPGVWNANSIKITFDAGNELDLAYKEGAYGGTEGIKFMLVDPAGGSHEAIQSITMQGQNIKPGDIFYYFTVSSNINAQYYITNAYSRIGDDSGWGTNWSYIKSFSPGTWKVRVVDDVMGTMVADEEVVL